MTGWRQATANVDLATDAVIQGGLKASIAHHSGAAALIIAHRLDTIIDCDTVLVLSAGVSPPSTDGVANPHQRPEGLMGVVWFNG